MCLEKLTFMRKGLFFSNFFIAQRTPNDMLMLLFLGIASPRLLDFRTTKKSHTNRLLSAPFEILATLKLKQIFYVLRVQRASRIFVLWPGYQA
jgi:hypothetical protein